jgi:hypothetical protein
MRWTDENAAILTARLTDEPPPSHLFATQAPHAAKSNEPYEVN